MYAVSNATNNIIRSGSSAGADTVLAPPTIPDSMLESCSVAALHLPGCGQHALWSGSGRKQHRTINMISLEAQHLITNLMKKGHRAGIIPHPSKAPPQPQFCCRRWQMIRVAELLAIEDVACSGHAAVIRQFTLSDWQSQRGPPQGSGLVHVNGKGTSRFACGCTSCYRDIWIRKHAWYT